MDPADAFSAGIFRWDPRSGVGFYAGGTPPVQQPSQLGVVGGASVGRGILPVARELEEMFQAYGVRLMTLEKIAELGFTASTLIRMRDDELDDMMATICHVFRWELLVGERYGVKAAVRAERRRVEMVLEGRSVANGGGAIGFYTGDPNVLDALSQEGLSEEPVQQEKEAAGSGGEVGGGAQKNKQSQHQRRGGTSNRRVGHQLQTKKMKKAVLEVDNDEDDEDEDGDDDDGSRSGGCGGGGGGGGERQREHPFIVTEPGEVARGKKNGLDYLFHLYDQCREFLIQVQNQAKERGEKCPNKVTNQVFRYAKRAGASYINKPKMRHYVHCYALHCLDEEASNALRRAFKERGENVGAWRQACYRPLVHIASRHAWDVDAVFAAHPRLSVWYVPTKLRQLCHLARNNNAAAGSASSTAATPCGGHHGIDGLPAMF